MCLWQAVTCAYIFYIIYENKVPKFAVFSSKCVGKHNYEILKSTTQKIITLTYLATLHFSYNRTSMNLHAFWFPNLLSWKVQRGNHVYLLKSLLFCSQYEALDHKYTLRETWRESASIPQGLLCRWAPVPYSPLLESRRPLGHSWHLRGV